MSIENEEGTSAGAGRRKLAGFGRVWLDRLKPFLFVVSTLVIWFLFLSLARIVITCQPGGDPCMAPSAIQQGWAQLWPQAGETDAKWRGYLYGNAWVEAFVSLVFLALAVWQGIRVFFPNRVELAPPKSDAKATGPRPLGRTA